MKVPDSTEHLTFINGDVCASRHVRFLCRTFLEEKVSILVICQELLKKDFDMFFTKKGNLNKPSVCFFKKPNVSSIRYCIRPPAFRRCTVGF